ncbi:MAG: hypothetical protein CVV07_00650 [Gammaproteobacteria bacterium HGW-Gammaproteobacteria-11]|nr:MAG: hypothetical protein CVV07_00650 [Gammaproteobacteria bacterium HGW-Gammaproteobacteria-11]
MKKILFIGLVLGLAGCTSTNHDADINNAYRAYEMGNCDEVYLQLSSAERRPRYRAHQRQPEVTLLRGLCLERQSLYLDAAQTYLFIQRHYPSSEYSFRAAARLQTLQQLGHFAPGSDARP